MSEKTLLSKKPFFFKKKDLNSTDYLGYFKANRDMETAFINSDIIEEIHVLDTEFLPGYEPLSSKCKTISVHQFLKNFENTKYDAFISGNLTDPGLLMFFKNNNINIPVFFITHSISYPELLKDIAVCLTFNLFNESDVIICTSNTAYCSMMEIFSMLRERISSKEINQSVTCPSLEIVPLGLNLSGLPALPMEKCEAKKLLEIDDDVSVILSVGRLSIGDKMDYLSVFEKIRKFKKIYTTKEKFLFVFAGGDIYGQKSLMEEVINGSGLKEHVRFVGNFDETEKHVLYSASDVFISLSDNFQETFGVNILEAMYYKLPCIVSDWNGYRDLVTNNENGFLVRTSWADCAEDINNAATIQGFYQNHLLLSKSVIVDTDEFIDKLRMLLENHGLRFQFGQNGYKKVVEKFDWKKNIENYVKLFNKYRISANCLKQTQNNALLSPDFFRCFKHYAGNIISGNEYVSFTRAAKTEEESITLQILASAAPEVYTRLYLSLYQEFAYKRKVLIDELTEWLKKSKKISGNEALRVILLFLKYNLLAFTRD